MGLNTLRGLYGTRTPLYVTWSGTGVTSIKSVELEVYVWTGAVGSRPATPHITINRTTGFGSNTTHTTDIAPLVSDALNFNIGKLYNDAILSEQDGRIAWVQIDYSVTYNTSSTDSGSSDIFQVIEGYSYFTEGANYEYQTGILAPTSERSVYEYNVEMTPVYLNNYSDSLAIAYSYRDRVLTDGGIVESLQCANIGWKTLRILLDDGNYFDYAMTEAQIYGTQAEDRIKLIPTGMANLKNWLLNSGSSLDVINSDWYKVQLLDTFENVIDERKFIPTCEAKYSPIQVAYISRYGTWNYATFFKRSEETINVTNDQYRSISGFVSGGEWFYSNHRPMYKKYNTNAKKVLTINSGFVAEDFKEVMEQIMLSEYVLVVTDSTVVKDGGFYTYTANNNAVAVNVSTNSLVKKKSVNDKLIEYTLDLEYAFDELNSTL